MWKRSLIVVCAILLIVGATGCITIKKKSTAVNNQGGVFASADRMETWTNKSLLMTPGATAGSITDANVYFIAFDPSDADALYLGTIDSGLYYSYNGGAGWSKVTRMPAAFVRDLAIDTKNKCTLYAAGDNKIYKSEDCGRFWKAVWYTDSDTKLVTSIAVDWYDPSVVYAGVSDGSLIKSEDFGISWSLSNKFATRVNRIVVDPNDSHNIYAGVLTKGLYQSVDKGVNWKYLNIGMKDFKYSNEYYDFSLVKSKKNLIIYASKFGLLRSLDGGTTWSEIKLMTGAGVETIYSVAIDPNDSNNIFYGTDKALYKSVDAGGNWSVKKMPTTRAPGELIVHPKDGNTVFMGVKTPQQ